ncbi:ArdC-like ssDNA-binding domain-containing protein [Priestia megaterium]|uniref:ArdC-like ssDNA-binding domain-containing protein n=1 Tax=Priestia megaterium TaxID=1404 RepID=UPI0035E365C6
MKNNTLDDITKKLEQGIKDVMTGSGSQYKEWLKFISSFHTYSFNNAMLIFLQNPNATLVKGYKDWRKLGRYVKKGEKAIKILAPIISNKKEKSKEEKAEKQEKKKAEEEKNELEIKGFRYVNVFDVSQTDGEPLPRSITPQMLEGDSEELKQLLSEWISAIDIPVVFEDTGSANGYYHLVENYIAIHKDRSTMQQLKTLVHEYAHHLLHRKNGGEFNTVTTDIKESQAESVAFIVMAHYNFDTSKYSFPYVAGWSGDIDIIKKIGTDIIKCSHTIIEKLGTKEQSKEVVTA